MTKAPAQFTFWFENEGDVLMIQDDGTWHKSVTNDIENVLHDIDKALVQDLSGMKIIYRDSSGLWDGITCMKEYGVYRTITVPISETDPDRAKRIICEWTKKFEKSGIVLFD